MSLLVSLAPVRAPLRPCAPGRTAPLQAAAQIPRSRKAVSIRSSIQIPKKVASAVRSSAEGKKVAASLLLTVSSTILAAAPALADEMEGGGGGLELGGGLITAVLIIGGALFVTQKLGPGEGGQGGKPEDLQNVKTRQGWKPSEEQVQNSPYLKAEAALRARELADRKKQRGE